MKNLRYSLDQSTALTIRSHLELCDADFDQTLSARVNLSDYAEKLAQTAARFEAWSDGDQLVGLVAMYCNAPDAGTAFITNVSVLPTRRGYGIAQRLMNDAVQHASGLGFERITLDVGQGATGAIALYVKSGFRAVGQDGETIRFERLIEGEPQ
ncbi:MAG: GNAT family N-acetyltransferase [Paracoccaceae bacterium]